MYIRPLVVVVALVLAGCSDSPDAVAPEIRSFTVSPSALPHGGGTVTLSIEVDGADSLTIDQGIGDVTGATSTDVAVTSTQTFTLTASKDTTSTTASTVVTVTSTITVSGKIQALGIPLANVSVVVGGKAPVTTSIVGTFTVPDVTPPYDVVLASSPTAITVYKNLTRPDPVLVAFVANGPPSPTVRAPASVFGTVSGGPGLPFASAPVVSVGGPNRVAGLVEASTTDGTFNMTGGSAPRWYGPTSIIATLHASLVVGSAGSESGYYKKLGNVSFGESSSVGGQNLSLDTVGVARLIASVTGPAIYNEANLRVAPGIQFEATGGGYTMPVSNQTPPATLSERVFPSAPGSVLYVEAAYNRFDANGEQSMIRKETPVAAAATLLVALPEPPRLDSPAAAATNVALTAPFTLTPSPSGGIKRVTFSSAGNPTITVFTTESTVAIPDLTPFAITIPGNAAYSWRAYGYGPLTSLDAGELASVIDIFDSNLNGLSDVFFTASAPRTFTTAP